MTSLHLLDYLAMALYFAVLIWIGVRVARAERGDNQCESFLAADRNMNLTQSTCSTAATDLGGAFSIGMGGLGFTLGISGSWFVAMSGLSILMVSFLMVPKVKRWSDKMKGLTTGDMFEARFDRRTGTLAAVVIGIAWFTFVGGQIIAGGKLLQVTLNMDLTTAVVLAGGIIPRLHRPWRPESGHLHGRVPDDHPDGRHSFYRRAHRLDRGRRRRRFG